MRLGVAVVDLVRARNGKLLRLHLDSIARTATARSRSTPQRRSAVARGAAPSDARRLRCRPPPRPRPDPRRHADEHAPQPREPDHDRTGRRREPRGRVSRRFLPDPEQVGPRPCRRALRSPAARGRRARRKARRQAVHHLSPGATRVHRNVEPSTAGRARDSPPRLSRRCRPLPAPPRLGRRLGIPRVSRRSPLAVHAPIEPGRPPRPLRHRPRRYGLSSRGRSVRARGPSGQPGPEPRAASPLARGAPAGVSPVRRTATLGQGRDDPPLTRPRHRD
jgi:hypothetical protein